MQPPPPDPEERAQYEQLYAEAAYLLNRAFEVYALLGCDSTRMPALEKVMYTCVVEMAHIEEVLSLH